MATGTDSALPRNPMVNSAFLVKDNFLTTEYNYDSHPDLMLSIMFP